VTASRQIGKKKPFIRNRPFRPHQQRTIVPSLSAPAISRQRRWATDGWLRRRRHSPIGV